MEYYLLTTRTVTQAQRMQQVLERGGVRAGVQRLPSGLSQQGCAYGVRVRTADGERAVGLARAAGMRPQRVFFYEKNGFREVTV